MALLDELKNIFQILLLNEKVIGDVTKRDTTKYALGFLITANILAFLLNLYSPKAALLQGNQLLLFPFVLVLGIVFAFLLCCVLHAVALLFKGEGSIIGLFRVFAYATGINILQVILTYLGYVPYLSVLTNEELLQFIPLSIIELIFMVYSLIISTYIIANVENLSKGKSVLVWLIPLVFFTLFAMFVLVVTMVPPV